MRKKRGWILYFIVFIIVATVVVTVNSDFEITHLPPILQLVILVLQYVIGYFPYILIFGAIGVFVLGGIYSTISNARRKKQMRTLFVEMDAPAFIEENRLRVEERKRKNLTAPYDKVNLAVGYFADGQFQKALDLLYDAQEELRFQEDVFLLVLHSNFITINLFMNRLDRVGYHRQMLIDRSGSKAFRRVRYVLTEYELAQKMRNGEYDDAIAYYNGVFEDAKSTPYAKALATFMVAVAYEGKGDMTARNKALSIVAQNGNRLIFAKLARETLNSSSRTLRERIGELAA